jgi:hypothetical protein
MLMRRKARHARRRRRAPARPQVTAAAAVTWAAAVAVCAALAPSGVILRAAAPAGAILRAVATSAPGSSAQAASGAVVTAAAARPAARQTRPRTRPASPAAPPSSASRIWGVTYGFPYYCGDGDGDGYDVSCASIGRGGPAPAAAGPVTPASGQPASRASLAAGYTGAGGCQSHIIADESGGNARAVNPESGAGGLYQFLPSTWHALGHSGLPQDAPVAEQNQAYYQEVAQSGYSAWAASGGCG